MTRRASLAILAAAFVRAQNAPPADGHWTKFIAWFTSLSPDSFHTGRDVLVLYREKLTHDGQSAAEVDEAIGSILKRIRSDSAFNTIFWNKHYQRATPQFKTEPNAFLVEVVSKLTPGQALDLGMGEGRNSIYLAQLGWHVTGVDSAEAGVVKARKRAESLGLKIDALVQNADEFDFGNQRWDLVCLLYAPGAQEVHDFDKRLAASLKPGGYIISEDPDDDPKVLADRWAAWEHLGLKLIRLNIEWKKRIGGNRVLGGRCLGSSDRHFAKPPLFCHLLRSTFSQQPAQGKDAECDGPKKTTRNEGKQIPLIDRRWTALSAHTCNRQRVAKDILRDFK